VAAGRDEREGKVNNAPRKSTTLAFTPSSNSLHTRMSPPPPTNPTNFCQSHHATVARQPSILIPTLRLHTQSTRIHGRHPNCIRHVIQAASHASFPTSLASKRSIHNAYKRKPPTTTTNAAPGFEPTQPGSLSPTRNFRKQSCQKT
jgi:hypothetical protein